MTLWRWYSQAIANAFGSTSSGNAPNIDFLSDTINVALVTSSYSPSQAHDFWDDVVANEISGTGYSANGATLGSKTLTATVANSFGTTWATGTAYVAGAIVRPTSGNTYLYRAQAAGTSHGSTEPTWPTTVGDEVADNTVTWTNVGVAIVQWDAADPSWGAGATFSGVRYAVMYDRTPATDATRPLIAYNDFGSDQSVTSGTFTITFDALGFLYHTVA